MNRKKAAKQKKKVDAAIASLSPYDDVVCWTRGDLPCPWTQEQIDDYQKKIDSAFGAEKALVLAWSMDRTYWDEMYLDDWHVFGEPKGKIQKIPNLLFKQIPIDDRDYLFISAPRWMILEKLHASQLEDSWEDSGWVEDAQMLGGRKRIRTKKPPEFFYQPLLPPLGTIALHTRSAVGQKPSCCERAWQADKSVCYGRYKPPGEEELREIRLIRQRMDKDGVAQRNDAPRSLKMLERARLNHQFFIKEAERRQGQAVRDLIMRNPEGYMGDVMKNYGASAKQIETALKEAFKQEELT